MTQKHLVGGSIYIYGFDGVIPESPVQNRIGSFCIS